MMINMSFHPSIALLLGVAAVPLPGAFAGYCNWGPAGTGASSTCDLDVQGGDWCNASSSNCESGCGGRWCTNDDGGGGGPPPPTPPPTSPPPPTGGPPTGGGGTATTTRYWDCSGGACACSYIPTGLGEGNSAHCHSNAMFAAPPNNAYGATYYGAAAISSSLGGGNWMAEGCGKCWKVTGTSNTPGYAGVITTMVLKGTNFCPDVNPMCGAGPHFDIAAPGFDVLAYSLSNTCPQVEPDEAEGFAACGDWLINNQDPDANCDCSLFNDPVLRAGCENFYSLKWDNPPVTYEELSSCPPELADLHCAHPYALEADMPETCADNNGYVSPPSSSSTSTTTSSSSSSTTSTSTTTTTTSTTDATTTTTAAATTTTSTTSSSTTAPPTISPGNGCCTWDFSTCGDSDFCNESESNCISRCGGKMWMENGPDPSCIPLNGACTNDTFGCCNPLGTVSCNGGIYYRQCQE